MAGFFDSPRIELSDCGVSVTLIYPSFVATRGRKASRVTMPVEACVRSSVKVAARRQCQVLIPSIATVGLWFKLTAPLLFDRDVRIMMASREI